MSDVATIAIVEHELQQGFGLPYMAHALANFWREAGHRVLVHYGADRLPPADVALLNVDMTVVPPDYLAALRHYPRVINETVRDIGRRTFSACLLERDSEWSGPVIVKTNANDSGRPEARLRQRASELGRGGIPDSPLLPDYLVCESLGEVPEYVWADPGYVVEKFLPERDERGYWIRVWTFLGDRERSNRYHSEVAIIKPRTSSGLSEPVEVPDDIRRWRDRLGFDFGKFDYVCPDGGAPVLLDVNRTPCMPGNIAEDAVLQKSFRALATGIEALIPALSRAVPPLPA